MIGLHCVKIEYNVFVTAPTDKASNMKLPIFR